jgi:hypothetical protein
VCFLKLGQSNLKIVSEKGYAEGYGADKKQPGPAFSSRPRFNTTL